MELGNLFNLQFLMFAEMAAGYILCRMHILNPKERSVLTKLVVNLLLPASIITSFSLKMTPEILSCFAQILAISMGIQILCTFLSRVLYNRNSKAEKPVLQYATICSNAGFLGNPVAEGVYGAQGLMFAQIYLIPLRIIMWTAGVSCFTTDGKKDLKAVLHTLLTHPCIIACGIGIVKMALQIEFPSMITSTLTSLGRCSTPLIMLFLGMILAEIGFKGMISKKTLIFSFIRLIAIPAVVLAGCLLCSFDPMVTGVSVLLAAMPAGTTTAILAEQYHADVEFAANVVISTTILSIALLPLWVILLNTVL